MFEKQRQVRRQQQPRRRTLELAETESLPPIPSHAVASPTHSSYTDATRKRRTPSSAGRDRKSAAEGKSASVRVDPGCSRIIKKERQNTKTNTRKNRGQH